MASIETTKMSSKGQIVIPEEVRKKLGLKAGDKFLVIGDKDNDVVILKTLSVPPMDKFDELIQEAHKQAELAGMKQADISKAIAKSRGKS